MLVADTPIAVLFGSCGLCPRNRYAPRAPCPMGAEILRGLLGFLQKSLTQG